MLKYLRRLQSLLSFAFAFFRSELQYPNQWWFQCEISFEIHLIKLLNYMLLPLSTVTCMAVCVCVLCEAALYRFQQFLGLAHEKNN